MDDDNMNELFQTLIYWYTVQIHYFIYCTTILFNLKFLREYYIYKVDAKFQSILGNRVKQVVNRI